MKSRPRLIGFTLIELLVVMSIIAMLITLAIPRYFHSVDKTRETVLRENLTRTRDALDKFYGDNGRYPDTLENLVTKKYLRSLPVDPITGSGTTWIIIPPEAEDKGAVYDIRSGSVDTARDGSKFQDW
ncbi:MAG TPA: prepilin-type N-terminal cleavage/methylation domain-containing protein [Rhodocyclaceae bacterium]|nr:prepilin-type N-terminal cleavage/methylation domain-containing protein [Rhodocyclaceae bacterium]